MMMVKFRRLMIGAYFVVNEVWYIKRDAQSAVTVHNANNVRRFLLDDDVLIDNEMYLSE